jgi:PAS domain S-box-containing protein
MLTKTGGKTYVIFNTSEMLYGAESVVQLTFMDISKQKRDREELIFQWRFLDNAEEIAIAIDEKGRIVYLNKFAAEIHGYDLEEMLGDNLASYLVQSEGEAESMQFSMMKSGKWKGRQLHRRRDGTEFIVEAKRSMLRVDDNVYELVIGIDVTENIELQRRNNLHSLLLNGTGDLAIATDMENRLIYLNEAAEKYFETRLEDEENKALEDISSEPLRNFLKIAASKPSEPLENKIRFPVRQESNAVIEFTGEIVRDHDEEVGTIFIGRKVT